jgi:hypothetical protein
MSGDGKREVMRGIVEAGTPIGVLAYDGREPVGWCSVAPRETYVKLQRSRTMPRVSAAPTWTVLCFFVPRPQRGQGVALALLQGAVRYALPQALRSSRAIPTTPPVSARRTAARPRCSRRPASSVREHAGSSQRDRRGARTRLKPTCRSRATDGKLLTMRTTWVVQTNVEPESTSPAALRRACSVEQLPFHEVSVIPGSATLPEMPRVDGPVVFHGRTTLILRAFEDPKWRHGVFFDPARFQHRAYVAAYGDAMLNADARVMSWEELLREPRAPGDLVFLKPNDDLKRFTGQILRFAECQDLYRTLCRAAQSVEPTSEVVLGKPCEIDAEWRLFIVDGEVVTGSMYRPSGEPHLSRELIDFAENAASRWAPARVFVLDVARVEGSWKIVECNCFNGSRFYSADVERLVRAVSAHQERVT